MKYILSYDQMVALQNGKPLNEKWLLGNMMNMNSEMIEFIKHIYVKNLLNRRNNFLYGKHNWRVLVRSAWDDF